MELVIPTTYFSSVSVNERVVFELILEEINNVSKWENRLCSSSGIRTEKLNAMR